MILLQPKVKLYNTYQIDTVKLLILSQTGCYFDVATPPVLPFVASVSDDMTPYKCFQACMKIDFLEPGKGFTVGVSEGKVCQCGFDFTSEGSTTLNVKYNRRHKSAFFTSRKGQS